MFLTMIVFNRENQKQFAIEDYLHDIGAISIISSSSQVMKFAM